MFLFITIKITFLANKLTFLTIQLVTKDKTTTKP